MTDLFRFANHVEHFSIIHSLCIYIYTHDTNVYYSYTHTYIYIWIWIIHTIYHWIWCSSNRSETKDTDALFVVTSKCFAGPSIWHCNIPRESRWCPWIKIRVLSISLHFRLNYLHVPCPLDVPFVFPTSCSRSLVPLISHSCSVLFHLGFHCMFACCRNIYSCQFLHKQHTFPPSFPCPHPFSTFSTDFSPIFHAPVPWFFPRRTSRVTDMPLHLVFGLELNGAQELRPKKLALLYLSFSASQPARHRWSGI